MLMALLPVSVRKRFREDGFGGGNFRLFYVEPFKTSILKPFGAENGLPLSRGGFLGQSFLRVD